ncbi:major facilitator superfamily domain-containing protein [Fomitopsis serialis]|uniref:major facilitator superfamily domain-containing protein n=1 Tax=Fomitopsis serialis TaxID=139415 RepID=UPI002007249D|nr:major facilitator superfamily domain-containing protein [Neoantrodia serialis]KAH9919548.1 major facilitator superfamily domain-containing protein [Neoantrodia serialis]
MPTTNSPARSYSAEKLEVEAVEYATSPKSTTSPPPPLTPEQEKRLWRKVDRRILPILTIMYLCSFLDRGNAKIQGLTDQLNLTGNKYNIALTMYFVPYCLCECPANLVLKKFKPSRMPVLTRLQLLWGVIMTLMGLVKTYPQLVGTRICLGITEAGLFPGVVYYLTLWYPRHMLQYRVGLFYGGATIAGAFSGILAYGISFMSGTAGLLGWSWIFILEGIATVVVGASPSSCKLNAHSGSPVDFPDTATFLTPEEREYIIWKKVKYDNSSVGEEEHFQIRHIKAAFMDWQVWLQIMVYFAVITPLYGISLFLPFGYDTAISELLTVPPYICATIVLLIFATWSDHVKLRSPFVLAGLVMCMIGFAINIADVPVGVKYFGTFFCVSGSYAAFPGIIAWLGNNLAGQYKRGVGMALHIGIGNFGGAIASNIYLSKDAPRYVLGHALELMFVGIGFIFLPITVLAYKRANALRDKQQQEMEEKGIKYSVEELRRLGDRAPDFRYTL